MITYQTGQISRKSKWINKHTKHNVIDIDEDTKSESNATSEEVEQVSNEIKKKLTIMVNHKRMRSTPIDNSNSQLNMPTSNHDFRETNKDSSLFELFGKHN